jgi:DUF2075 family protein
LIGLIPKNSRDEVGCIHTTQGYDLNYTGIIFGNEITYDRENNQIKILKENYYDVNGKQSIVDQKLKFHLNIYKINAQEVLKGHIYVCDKTLRTIFSISKFKTEKQM